MKTKFNKGNELDKQIYKEGDSSWGLKEGFLEVEDVKDFIKELKSILLTKGNNVSREFIKETIDDMVGDELTK